MSLDVATGFWVGGVCVAIVCCVGLICNILSVVTLAHPLARGQNFNLYLLILGIFDSFVLIDGLLGYSLLCLVVFYPCVYGTKRDVECNISGLYFQNNNWFTESI